MCALGVLAQFLSVLVYSVALVLNAARSLLLLAKVSKDTIMILYHHLVYQRGDYCCQESLNAAQNHIVEAGDDTATSQVFTHC